MYLLKLRSSEKGKIAPVVRDHNLFDPSVVIGVDSYLRTVSEVPAFDIDPWFL